MRDPLVCAVMLVNGRPEMVTRAVKSFDVQTYRNAYLEVLDTTRGGQVPIYRQLADIRKFDHKVHVDYLGGPLHWKTVGALRNLAAGMCSDADVIVHWDSDDWSHPRRIEEQVALLQASGKQCVGYNEALFWDTRPIAIDDQRCVSAWQAVPGSGCATSRNEAWVYSNFNPRYVLGASMCYWRSAWEACPFDDAPHEDQRWWLKNASKCVGVSGLQKLVSGFVTQQCEPRLICQIHGSNTSGGYSAEAMASQEWSRAPEFDSHAAKAMAL